MTSRLVRAIVAISAVGMLAALTSSCSSTANDAATVKFITDAGAQTTEHINRADFQDDLDVLGANQLWRGVLERSGKIDPATNNPGDSTDAEIAAIWLSRLIEATVIDAEFAASGLEVTPDDTELARAISIDTYGEPDPTGANPTDPAPFEAFPKEFQDQIIEREARRLALARASVPPVSEEQARAFYDENIDRVCPDARAVSLVLVATRAEADAVLADLQSGASFEQVASEKSTDSQTSANGGFAGCLPPDAQGVPEAISSAVAAAQLGVPTAPVETDDGFYVFLVQEPTFEMYAPAVAQELNQQYQQAVAGAATTISQRAASADVHVDPRYGRWQPSDTRDFVVAPNVPEPRQQREDTVVETTTTTFPQFG